MVEDVRYWIRTMWEHIVSHYLYGTGLVMLFALQQWVYRDAEYSGLDDHGPMVAVKSLDNRAQQQALANMRTLIYTLLAIAIVFHSFIIAGAAIDFPSGLITGLIYVLLGIGCTLWYDSPSLLPSSPSS